MGTYKVPAAWLVRQGNTNAQMASTSYRTLDDGSDSTYIDVGAATFFASQGRVDVGPVDVTGAEWTAGRPVLAVRLTHRFNQPSSGFQGWPDSWLRLNGSWIPASRILQPDGQKTGTTRVQRGAWTYRSGRRAWTISELNALEYYSTVVEPHIATGNRDYRLYELYMEYLWSEPLVAPTVPSPANAATIATSNPQLSYQIPAPQDGQIVRGVIEVARNNTFTNDKRTYVTDDNASTSATSRATFTGAADLGPGVWYMRAKTQDVIDTESAWSAITSFTITHAALPAPRNASPAPGSIVVNPLVSRAAEVTTAASDSRTVGIEFQFSLSSTFASGVVTHTVPVTSGVTTGIVSYTPDTMPTQRLAQGQQYMRTRAVDKWGQTGPWSTTDSFTVQHQPVAQNVSPTSNRVIDPTVTPARWTFGDPWVGDKQTAYQVRVYTEAGALVYDSTKKVSEALQQIMTIPAQYQYQRLRLTVSLWDIDDATSSSVASYYFISSTSPAITMAYPEANGSVGTGQPTFQWNPGIVRPEATQKSYELKVYNTVSGNLIHTSGVVNSVTARSYTPPQTILNNGGSYQLTLRIVDSDGLTSTLTRNFTASYQAPAGTTLTVDPQSYLEGGYVDLDWGLSSPDDYFITWRVYRRKVGQVAWDLIATIDDSSITRYHDWLVPEVGEFQYTVTQVADRFGAILESSLDVDPPVYYIRSEDFWLIDEDDEENNLRLYSVSDNPYNVKYERNEYIVKGRGRRTNFGTRIGLDGVMTCKVRPRSGYTPSQLINQLEQMQSRRYSVLLRDPFGRITRITIGDLSISPMAGTGPDEFADVSIPWTEVY